MSGEAEESGETQAPTSGLETVQQPASAAILQPPQKPGHQPIEFRFFNELKRRNVGRVAILYLVVCWLILEPTHVIFHMLEVPVWANRLVIIIMALGFPAILIFAWVYELTPDGIKPAVMIAPHKSIRAQTGQRLNRAIIAVMAVALGYFFVDKFWLSSRVASNPHDSIVADHGAAPPAAMIDKSIAVLPFADMSEKKDQEYFGDGIAEEISALLAKIPHIKVIGRASSFQFKGLNEDLRAIGEKLNTEYIVEGSVRKAADKIRVTAQLIDTHSGTQLWADSYDSDYTNILELQEQIAAGAARALQLVVEANEMGPSRPLRDPEAYTFYLRGLSELDEMHQSSLFDAQSNFEHALELDPSFLRAAEALARSYVEQAFDESLSPRTAWQKAREVAQRALDLDSSSAPAHGVLGMVYAANDFNWVAAEAEFAKAFVARPRDPITLRFAALVTHARGRQEEALRRINASISVDPLNPYARESLGQMLFCMGDLDRAEPALRKSIEITPLFDGSRYYLGMIMLLRGQSEAARHEVLSEVAENARDSGMSMEFYARGLKTDSDAALARLKLSSSGRWPFGIAQAYAFRRDVEGTFEWLEKSYDLRDPDLLINVRGDPLLGFLRGDPRYQTLLRKMNLLE